MAAQRKPNSSAEQKLSPVPSTLNMAEVLRLAQPPADEKIAPSEDRMTVVWRVLGGTVLSIIVTLMVTVYQSLSSTLADLRTGQSRIVETQSDFAKKDDLTNRATQLWTAQKATSEAVPELRTRTSQMESQIRSLEQDRKEMQQQIYQLSERLARSEGRRTAPTTTKPATKAATKPEVGPPAPQRMDVSKD